MQVLCRTAQGVEGEKKERQTEAPHSAADLATLLRKVSEHFQIDPAELRSKTRSPIITEPRGVLIYLMRELYHIKWERLLHTLNLEMTQRGAEKMNQRTAERFKVDKAFRREIYLICEQLHKD